ncbi:glycine cleavage system aminomethyltransferase GcvT [Agromyces albus]|uniref:glycine cleavage system aminomethyltransferase GcvT n=1 Tax=Agromyces albus TaxID=205332 RepID=UPI0027801888|nr:glycine cleavage system aminomethyltransferase GcvT [Agromyces albus]MDQ0575969.1 aminomethyltransferase [Agromyces albus]
MTERLSPLDGVHRAAGASFTDFAGWQMPVRYSSDLAEHHAVRNAAGIFDLSHMGEIVLIGPESAAALDFALAGKLSAIEIGQAKYSLLLAEDGGIIDDLVVYRTGDDRYMVVANASNREVVADEFRARAGGFDTDVYDESDDVALIAVQGPASREILLATAGFTIEGGHPDGEDVPEALASLRYYRAIAGAFRGEPMLIARTGYTGEDGFELYIAPEHATALWEALTEAGAAHALVPAGLASRDTLRLEAGMPLYGHELSRDILPVQAGLGRVVALSKEGDFVGRAAIEQGPAADAPVLVGLAAEGRRAGRAGYEVFDGDGADSAPVGVVTSGALSPTLGHPIAMAFVAPDVADPGRELYLDVRGTRVPASVVALPFYKRNA